MKITGGGEVVRFDGHVVMNIDKLPPPAESAPEQPAAPEPVARSAKARTASGKPSNPK
jgi:lipopolysaccharide export system protein LptC